MNSTKKDVTNSIKDVTIVKLHITSMITSYTKYYVSCNSDIDLEFEQRYVVASIPTEV